VTVTRRLGIRYLWVDAICIVQDDFVHTSIHANDMSAIYSNATVTIAATNS
ncbi:hypothetical protein BJ878DRAFT_391123, partial [Calycina marina]